MKLTAVVAMIAAIVSLVSLAPPWVFALIVAWVLLQLVFALLPRPSSRAPPAV